MSDEHLVRTKKILATQERKYRRSAMRWKVGYRFLFVVSALLASAAAIISKLSLLTRTFQQTGRPFSLAWLQ
ncbi:hypothetical protein [Aeromonas hydrophila]|uniref:hypothetical protein n=1 Tax=Aeromonas hydrophila TaxID=644 RepID=UPI002366B2BA|nr:hypothetical protein [Aeromonas hydrophila]WDF91711.1 hypothetical protein PUB83_05420 [Aeromonas hydrophila subsp. hydrophila]